jgi:hypothetical protein
MSCTALSTGLGSSCFQCNLRRYESSQKAGRCTWVRAHERATAGRLPGAARGAAAAPQQGARHPRTRRRVAACAVLPRAHPVRSPGARLAVARVQLDDTTPAGRAGPRPARRGRRLCRPGAVAGACPPLAARAPATHRPRQGPAHTRRECVAGAGSGDCRDNPHDPRAARSCLRCAAAQLQPSLMGALGATETFWRLMERVESTRSPRAGAWVNWNARRYQAGHLLAASDMAGYAPPANLNCQTGSCPWWSVKSTVLQ